MDGLLEKAAEMELGQAGYPVTPSLPSVDGNSEGRLSASEPDSSTKPLQPNHSPPRTLSSLSRFWARLRSITNRLGRWVSHSQEGKMKPVVRQLGSCPRGYPGLAAFLDSDECFSVYRRFGFLQSRLLLDKQDKLRELEEALDKLDKREEKASSKRPMTMDLPKQEIEPRQKLLATIEEQFTLYANLLDTASKMMALSRPSEADYTSVQNYMQGHEPLLEAEASWVDKQEDLVTLRAGREHAWLDSGIDKMLKWFHCDMMESIFGDEQTRQKSSGDEVYYSRQRINNFANTIITFMVLILLVVPIYVLYHLINDADNANGKVYAICMGILIISTLAFSAVLCLFTRAKRHEILAAAAAYCAVLVVFFGNVGPARK
ncbi:hypothetical protein K458DRAFT_369079 [Lentithecium fluviatile CBS 122367]|uniref:DUF6594 domain-containing protein n=1 Tax=Lentithecium fluviatile CBS 122367 TaxID=1168545 RepID=A0A6G1IXX4_9PLEO|nr:hypothetical protein K458DRAFT_369079 [Lentithecium fluviatile CBS 122367]